MWEAEQVRVEQRRLALTLAAYEPVRQCDQSEEAGHDERPHRLAALLPDQDAQDDAAHAHDGEDGADHVDVARSRVGHVADQPDVGEYDGNDHDLEEEPDPPRQVRGDETSEQWPHRCGDGRRRPDQGVGLLALRSLEVPVDEGLHRGQQQRCPQASEDRPEDDDGDQVLGQRHRQGAGGVGKQAQDVGALATDEVAHLAADQDERGRDQGLEGDRRLDAAHRRVEILDHCGDRDVHQRGVDDEHEHRRCQQQAQPRAVRRLLRGAGARLIAHGTSRAHSSPTRRLAVHPQRVTRLRANLAGSWPRIADRYSPSSGTDPAIECDPQNRPPRPPCQTTRDSNAMEPVL